jgi:hypothetical protein
VIATLTRHRMHLALEGNHRRLRDLMFHNDVQVGCQFFFNLSFSQSYICRTFSAIHQRPSAKTP